MGRIYNIPLSDMFLTSTWKYDGNSFVSGPTTTTLSQTANIDLAGITVTKLSLGMKVSEPLSGISLLTVNGVTFGNNSQIELSMGRTGDLKLDFVFRANGVKEIGEGNSTVFLSDIWLYVYYENTVDTAIARQEEYGYSKGNQAAVVLNMTNSQYYLFDGVKKIGYSYTSTFDENPDASDKSKYVNGAKNEQDKIVMEVVMSDVENIKSSLTTYTPSLPSSSYRGIASEYLESYDSLPMSRSSRALNKLYQLKESRVKLMVITRNTYHSEMVLSDVAINQDENFPYGWEGQLTFKKFIVPKFKSSGGGGGKRRLTDNGSPFGQSDLATMIGTNIIASIQNADENRRRGDNSGFYK